MENKKILKNSIGQLLSFSMFKQNALIKFLKLFKYFFKINLSQKCLFIVFDI